MGIIERIHRMLDQDLSWNIFIVIHFHIRYKNYETGYVPIMRKLSEIAFFLHSGYLPTYNKENIFDRLLENNPLRLEKYPEDMIYDENIAVEEGIKALKSTFENIQGDLHIVPLSGGLDSRTILAELIERGLRKQIITVTFGVPGSYDYEIGSFLSKKFGLRYEEIDLNTINVSQGQLLETAINGSSWTFLIDAFYNSLIPKKFGKEATYWSGFPGGCLLGLRFPHGESTSWKAAQDYFLDYGKLVYSINLLPPGFQLRDSLPEAPILDPSILSYDDQLYFVIRQQNYMFRVLIFKGFNYRTPLFSPEWAKFSLRLPLEFRSGGHIFHRFFDVCIRNGFRYQIQKRLGDH